MKLNNLSFRSDFALALLSRITFDSLCPIVQFQISSRFPRHEVIPATPDSVNVSHEFLFGGWPGSQKKSRLAILTELFLRAVGALWAGSHDSGLGRFKCDLCFRLGGLFSGFACWTRQTLGC